jgi:hypothetical protein
VGQKRGNVVNRGFTRCLPCLSFLILAASDLRLGQQAMTVACNFDKVFPVTERTYIGMPGLASDVLTLREKFRYRVNMYKMKEEREIQPETFAHLVSSTLYERRWVGPARDSDIEGWILLILYPFVILVFLLDLDHTSSNQSLLASLRLMPQSQTNLSSQRQT